MAVIHVERDDPQLREKASRFFLDTYRENRAEHLARLAERESASPKRPSSKEFCHLGLDNLPDEYLSSDDFLHLLGIRNKIIELTNRPIPEMDDGIDAGILLVRMNILAMAQSHLEQLLVYLLLDRKFHPERKCIFKAIGSLGLGDAQSQQRMSFRLETLVQCTALCNAMLLPIKPNSLFVDELKIFDSVGEIFFNTLQSIFPLDAVNKCRIAFTRLMRDLGLDNSNEIAANYIRRRKTMQRAIEDYEAHGGAVDQTRVSSAVKGNGAIIKSLNDLAEKVEKVGVSTESLSKKVDAVDRRQKTLHAYVKKVVLGFVRLFMPRYGRPGPTAGEIKNTLLPGDRYVCLQNIKEPHRSQLKQVIDHTKSKPIVYRQKNATDFSLADAAREVWNREHAKWDLIAGSFASFEQLKSSCYNLKNGKHDPFYYSP